MLTWLKNIFTTRGEAPKAIVSVESNARLLPTEDALNSSENYRSRGNQFLAEGKLAEAVACYQQAIQIDPSFPEGYLNLGFALKAQKRYEEAERALKQALLLNPKLEDAHYLIGAIAQHQGKLNVAIESFNTALALKPDFEIVYCDLCHALFQSGKIGMAKRVIENALTLNPNRAEFHCDQGNLFYHEKQLDQAIACYQTALLLKPDSSHIHTNMGNVLMKMGNIEAAIDSYEKVLALDPNTIEAESCLLFIRAYHSKESPNLYLTAAKRYGQKVSMLAQPYKHWPVSPAGRGLGPLRVGLVSGDLNNHPVAFFLESMLEHINTECVELVAYPSSFQEDEITARLKPHFISWNSIFGLSDEAAARKIHADGIHILIDLAGHTTYNRLSMFAWKPAPIQVNWLGYLASTGVPGIDYLLADPVSVPDANRQYFTETIWHLPNTVNCLTPPATSPRLAVTPPPAIHNGHITFGCFQNLTKVNDAVLAVWGRIFQALPDARLRLQIKQMESPDAREQILKRLSNVGIAPQRVNLKGIINSRDDYLVTHAEVDIILDTFPCPGITTTCEALWMGVPTLTLTGDTLLSRQGVSLLSCAGLAAWIASDEDDYVARALAHASDINQLAQLRLELRQKVLSSPIFDAPRFALDLEQALQNMWQLNYRQEHGENFL